MWNSAWGYPCCGRPAHTDGNHSLCVNTPDGVWISSENGMAADSWQPELSRIPGVRAQAKFYERDVVLNGNTLEDSLDQYDSMIKEFEMASYCKKDPGGSRSSRPRSAPTGSGSGR
ncbi:hypothetical protein Cocul_00701 [Corynebacterium oculi]|uniref:Uncharacterized protein n=2 Tax=Corynebacterium oculi TaxID=1544416 RepID=A0A0Q0Z7K6_9CORY|nr:hypothetical protein Cocul_00701 [Corynebacterium oculi]